jgi:hypothetical protein
MRQLKEIKDQLVKERKSFEKQMQMAQIQSMNPPPSPRGSLGLSLDRPPARSPSSNSLNNFERNSPPSTPSSSTTSTPHSLTPSNSYNQLPLESLRLSNRASLKEDISVQTLQQEINALVSTIGELQADKWKVEEKLNLLQETVQILKTDNEKKESIIKNYVVNTKVQGRTTPEMEAIKMERANKPGIMGSLFRGSQGNMPNDVMQKMTSVLEDTLLKNIQLQVQHNL